MSTYTIFPYTKLARVFPKSFFNLKFYLDAVKEIYKYMYQEHII